MKTFTTYAEKKAKQFLNLLQGYTKGIRITAILILLLMGVNNVWGDNNVKVYCAIKASDLNCYTLKVNANIGDNNTWRQYTMEKLDETYEGRLIYQATIVEKYGGVDALQFQLYDGSTWKSQKQPYGTWTTSSTFANKLYVYDTNKWITKTNDPSYTVYFVNKDDWTGTIKAYAWNSDCDKNKDWSGADMTSTGETYKGKNIYSITLNKRYANIIFNNGSSQTGDLTLGSTNIGKMYDGSNWVDYNVDPVVTFKANGGTGSDYTQTVKYNTSTALTANTFTRTGYSFNGWKTAANSGTSYADKANVTFKANTTLYAQWTANQYTINYKDQGGSNFSGTHASGYPTTHTYGTATTLKTASKTGYTFEGWYKESACTNNKVTSLDATAYTAAITLYAKWTPNTNTPYVVKHCKEDLNGNYPAELTDTQNLTGTTDSKVTPSVKSYEGFTAPSTQTVTIKADGSLVVTYKYTRNSYQLTWELEGGTIQTAGTAAGQVKYEAPLTAPTVTKEGHNFTSWNPAVPATMPASDATYTAQWQKIKYTVVYGVVGRANGTIALNSEDPITDQNKQDFEYGSTLTFTAAPADGYRVQEPQGWFSNEAGNTSLGNGTANTYTINSLTDAASVFVAFEKIPASTYIVTFDANGGSGTMNSQSFTENEPQNLTTNAFTRTGYTFAGWNTAADGTGTSYTDEESVTLTTAGLTLYAQWTANTYTVTLDQEGATTPGTRSMTVTYDAAMPTITCPTKNGYAFMGYWDAKNGAGNQYYKADGSSARTWDKIDNTTLYAYFKKAEITSVTLDKTLFESGETGYVTVTNHTIEPTPAGTVVVCWTLCYTNGTPVEGHNAIEDNGTVKFAIDGLSAGTYKIVASLRLNNCNGEELDTAEATFVVAGSYTVTIKYTCDGQEIAGRTTIEGHPSRQTEVTAAEIGGYNFVKWELGDGISTTAALNSNPINITANYEGYLTATYEKKKLIFLDLSKKFGTADWPAPHIYLYSEEFWNENLGTGATDPKCVAKGAMSPVPGTTGMWFYEYEGVNNFNGYVAFTPTDKMSQANFYDTEVIHRGDFSIGTPVFVPAEGQTANIKNENKSEGKNAQYYNKGHWTKYMGGTGYTLKIYNHKEKEGRKELMSVPFTGSSLYLPFTAVVDLEAGQTFGYKIVRDNDKWYKNNNDGTMTVNSHTNWPFIEDKNNGLACGIQTVAAGIHTFTLTLNATSGNFEVTVDYPVTVGDYRILYKDNTRATYKPSQIIKKEESEPIVGYFVRPDNSPELKVQTAAYISGGGVTWSTSENEIFFKPNANWQSDGARFAAYFYNASNNKWVDLKANGDLYSCAKPTTNTYTHVIFCRMDPAKNNAWANVWTQTIDIKLPTDGKNLYTLEEGAWKGQIRLKPNANWKADGARFAAYFFHKEGETLKKEEWYTMYKDANSDTYWCPVPDQCSKIIFCRMNPENETNGWSNKWDQTNDLDFPSAGNECYTVKEGAWSNGDGSWSNSGKSWSTISGSIIDLTEELKEKLDEIKGDNKKAPDSVYTIHLSNNEGTLTIEKVAFYTGNFYIRVDAAAGKWYDYKTNPDNLMTYSAFSESDANSFGEKFSHYKTEWCSDGMNVKFVIANDYSPCISDTLVQDTENSLGNIDEYGNLKNGDKYNANIRFMWNRRDNKVSRAYIAAATDDAKKFLVLKTDKQIKNNKDQSVNEIIFQDTQNWIYEYTIKAQPETRVKLYACYPDVDEAKAQHFRGEYDNPTTFDGNKAVQILGGTGEAWNTIRVLYDFKTNRLMGAWVPESAISTEQAINADLMVIRRHQENATCVTLTNENSKLTDVKTAYGAMQFNRWTINNRGGADDLLVEHCTKLSGSHRVYDETITNEYHPVLPLAEQTSIYERGLYFISFPFDVHLSDVFGLGTYGTHWVISTYNGKRRAERGYFEEDCINEDCTNWDYIWDPSGFVMKANEGYLLSLDLDLMKHDNTDFWANNTSQLELFFPSTAAVKSIEKTDYTMPDLTDEYLCKINHNTPDGDRRVKDSYWRCIGVPSFADYDGSLTTDGTSPIEWKADYTWEPDNGAFPFLYEWNVTNNDLVVRSTNSYKFRATYAYLIQNGNEIHWEAVNTNKPASIIARDQIENVSNYEWKIALLRNDAPADHTFIRMTDNESVTSAFDFHQDLSKEFNYGANIYTLVGYERLAANSLPMSDSTTIIPLGVSAQEAGDYTITMPEGVESIGITLVDNETGIHTNLSAGQEYTLTLNKGICENRLFIEVSPIQNTPTDLEYTTGDTREQTTRKVLINEKLYIIRDGVVYDAQGHRL